MSVGVPKYRLHKASGQALVPIRKRIYLGRHGFVEHHERYRRLRYHNDGRTGSVR